jgi:hypothetical protein
VFLRWNFVLMVAAAPTAPSLAAEADSSYAVTSLSATTAPPWIPPAPVSATSSHESALRLPGRILSLPLVALGNFAESSLIYAENHDLYGRMQLLLAREKELGLAIVPASLGDGTGLGGEVRWAPPPLGSHIRGAIGTTTQQYFRGRMSALAGPFGAAYQSEWRPREPYFGPGLSVPHSGEAAYAVRSQSARLTLTWGWSRADSFQRAASLGDLETGSAPAMRTLVSAWAGPREVFLTRGRALDDPSIETNHPAEAALVLDHRVEHFAYGAALVHDARSGLQHWSQGWRASIQAERYDRALEALAFRDAHTGARRFTRITYRAEAGASFGRDPRTLRLALKTVDQQLDRSGGTFLTSDLASLGGADLAGYEPGRFRDVDLIVAKLSYIYPLGKNLEFDLHTEAGGVYPDLGASRLSSLENSFGVALRIRSDVAMMGMIGFDRSIEQTRIRFSIGGVE